MSNDKGRIYYLRHQGGTVRLVRADNRSQAIGFAARREFNCEVASQNTLVELVALGTKVENSREAQIEMTADCTS